MGILIELLEKADLGLNIAKITELSGLSRNTVKKYLKVLEKETIIEMEQVGRSKLYFLHKERGSSDYDKAVELRRKFFLALNMALDAFMEVGARYTKQTLPFLRDLARQLGETGGGPIYGGILKNLEIGLDSPGTRAATLKRIASVAVDIFQKVIKRRFGAIIEGELVPPLVPEESVSQVGIRIRVLPEEVASTRPFFHAVAGFFEGVLRSKFRALISRDFEGDELFLDVLDVQEEKNLCYYALSLKKKKKGKQGNKVKTE
ncbi:MAG: hypothetical protein ACTSU5_19325 [Promethearchaeota archaeon]